MDQNTTRSTNNVANTSKIESLKRLISKRPPKKRLLTVLAVSAGFLVFGAAAAFTLIESSETLDPVPTIETTYVAPPEPVYSPLTGLSTDKKSAERVVTGVMIENSIDARPQSGLEEAGVVFEAIAEGGITRFLALYQEARPKNIGPIRSARPYYVEWARGFDAAYLHSGGSGAALALIPSLGVKDIDHGKFSTRIADRVSSRFAPHNVYSNFDKIDALNKELGYTSSKFEAFERKDPTVLGEEKELTANKISFDISGANYNTAYTYSAKTGDYKRTMAGLPHKDQESGKQISPEIVVAMITTYGINSNGIHSIYKTVGTGEAFIFQDGMVTKATWKKSSKKATFELLDKAGDKIALNRGQTWITAVPSGRVSYTP